MMSTENHKRPTAFIDRDGTLIEEVNFLSNVEDLRVFPYTAEALKLLKAKGFLIVVVTNQSGIGRNIYTEADMHAVHEAMQIELDGAIDAFYFCPHLPCDGCECRKPNLGMLNSAQSDFDIDLENSWMIGDKKIDVETGYKAGIRSAMVMTGYGPKHRDELIDLPTVFAKDLLEAAEAIVNSGSAASGQ
ncbi:MAG TPA: HAD family hydrolase [Pyrinomonadaceae bacterium]|nr:HAD family hydrolase [Pyrinomonadaceae bacterium]